MKKQQKKVNEAVALLRQLAHPIRLGILCNLLHQGELSVGEIVDAAGGASQSQISQFLAKMRSDDLVKCRKVAQTVYYQIKSPQAKKVVKALYTIYCGA